MKTTKKTGLERQEEFLRGVLSQRIPCPACGGMHSYIEAAEAGGGYGSGENKTICPVTKQELKHGVTLVGGEQSWQKKIKTFILRVVYEIDPAHYQMSDDDSGLRSSTQKVEAETYEDACEEIEDCSIDNIHSIELISVK